jgi:hypothetical protein
MTTRSPVTYYKVFYWTPKTTKRLEHSITIEVFFDQSKTGCIHFYPEDTSRNLRDRVYAKSEGTEIYLEFYERQFPQVIDLLRNESCEIYITAQAGSPGSFTAGEGSIRTAKEPGAEGEARSRRILG